ncbi:MAG: tyrosine-type recombinase/integrase [Anaerolineae bacterium]|nr:tyrosine-type recombinase/integrase [Anaerolineae bacterium]
MTSINISFHTKDSKLAHWLANQLSETGHKVILESLLDLSTPNTIKHFAEKAPCFIVLISPDSASSKITMQQVTHARQINQQVFPILARPTDPLPWYINDLPIEDFTTDPESALKHLLKRLPPTPNHKTPQDMTLGNARDAYLQRATLKSQHTIDSYRRAIELFLEFLEDRSTKHNLPIQQHNAVTTDTIPLNTLSQKDAPIFLHFAQWLVSPSSGKQRDKRPYKSTTVELRLAGVQNWFQFMDDHGWLPADFPLAKAKRIVRDELRGQPNHNKPPEPPEHIEEVIYYYDALALPDTLQKPDVDPERVRRWELKRLRNRALLHTLAETGGRISEILSLNLDEFPPRYLNKNEVLRVEVTGKGGHTYYLRFFDSLPAIRAYILARGADLKAPQKGNIPLFVSHAPSYDGNRTSRVVAWRIVQQAAKALGLRSITPHDFRHWRATQLINAGHALDVVQEYLGHRSVETTRAYYAHTDPLRVDDAARNTRLPNPEDI